MPRPLSESTRAYEDWLATQVALVPSGLREKHEEMATGPFPFLRATWYRWLERWEEEDPVLRDAPRVLAVGDLHVENFGTWRDAHQRLVWGVNDLDEAANLPCTQDLVRLVTSAIAPRKPGGPALAPRPVARAVLRGYRDRLASGGQPFVLEERHGRLRRLADDNRPSARKFWEDAEALEPIPRRAVPAFARELLLEGLGPRRDVAFRTRQGGLGSRGRPRFVAIVERAGGYLGREVKSLVPSAASWHAGSNDLHVARLLATAVRSPDPFLEVRGRWIRRRYGPDHARLPFDPEAPRGDLRRHLRAMGAETANVHLGTGDAATILAHLDSLGNDWLEAAAARMAERVTEDYRACVAG